MKKVSLRSSLLLFLAATIWGTAFVAQSVGMDYVGPLTFNAARSLIGGIVLIPVVLLLNRKKDGPAFTPEGRKTTITGGLCCGVLLFAASSLQQIGIQYTTVGKAGFITALYIIMVPIFSIFLRKRPSFTVWIGVALALVGLYLLCMTDSFSLSGGDTLVFFCAIAFTFHILVIDHFSSHADGVMMSCIQFFVSGVLCLICALIFEEPQLPSLVDCALPILYAGVLSSGVAYTLQIVGQKDMDPTIASLILSLESVISAISGWILLNQNLSGREIFGCVLMFGAIILAQLPKRAKKTPQEA